MATGAPAGSLAQEVATGRDVGKIADEDVAVGRLLLVMAAQAKGLVARNQQPRIDAAVRSVAARAAFAQGLMLEHERSCLCDVAPRADFIGRLQFRPAALASVGNHVTFMRIVAIRTAHLALKEGMMRRQVELGPLVQMACETGLGRFARVDDGPGCSARFHVQTAGAVARFATDVLGVIAGCLQTSMARGAKVLIDIFMAGFACFRTDERRARNLRWSYKLSPTDVGAGNDADGDERAQQKIDNPRQVAFPAGDDLTIDAI